MTNNEIIAKQHAKVADEAVSGWEKAEAEAVTLKNHLESITLLKLTAEDRALHLDGALKECMRQIRNLKEEHDKKLQEAIINKTKLFDRMKLELDTKIANLEQELLRSASDNAALSRSLQERAKMLIRLSEEKSQAEADIEHLRSNIESCEKEINSLKYEVHIARKEVEIRSEEKDMSVRSAEVANKQHIEGVKKIAKLEAECQRLRGLVRKKLPGPAALAQMKLEVESLGRDYGESRLRRSPVKRPTSHSPQLPEFALENAQKYQKDNEFFTERLFVMEEETKMLKEALAKRNSELQASRSLCAQTASKLHSLEAQLQANDEQKSSSFNSQVPIEDFYSTKASNPPSITSFSEDANEDSVSCAGSWATVLIKENYVDSPHKPESTNHLDLMDDFLEMEKLAYQSNGPNGSVTSSNVLSKTAGSELVECDASLENQSGEKHGPELQVPSEEGTTLENPQPQADSLVFVKLKSKISMALEAMSKEKDVEKLIVDIKNIMQDMYESLYYQPMNGVSSEEGMTTSKDISLAEDGNTCNEVVQTTNHDLENAISQIFDFVMILGKETKPVLPTSSDGDELNSKFDIILAKYTEAINSDINVIEFVLDISHVLSEASELHFSVQGFKNSEVDTGSSDCIDKIVLPENEAVVDSSGERYPNGCAHFSDSASDPDVPNDGNLVPTSESRSTSWKCSLEEFEQLKMDNNNLTVNLARCTENFESTKVQLLETEQLLAEVKSELTSALRSNSLAETQLKCMAESYKSLETRTEDLQTKLNLLQGKIDSLDFELQEERRIHQDALIRCKDLQEQLERFNSCSAADDDKISKEKELESAAEKLAECQESIFLLGKQLKALRPQTDILSSPDNTRGQKVERSLEESMNMHEYDPSEMDSAISFNLHRAGSDSPLDLFNDSEANELLRSPVNLNYQKHRSPRSGSSSTSSTPTPEKQARGFSRFFSSK